VGECLIFPGRNISGAVADTGFVSDRAPTRTASRPSARVEGLRVMIDPHTADGVRSGSKHREQGVPLVCMETAQPTNSRKRYAKRLAGSRSVPGRIRRPGENLPQRFEVMDAGRGQADTTSRRRHHIPV